MLKQRVFGLCLGDEDLNDHRELRHDVLWQPAVERDARLASAPTLCRLENRASRAAAWRLHEVIVERFIASFRSPPAELALDFDATDDPVRGRHEGRFFHGDYDHHCFLPLYVFCGEQLLVSYLRPSKIDVAKHAWAILALLVKRLRRVWPKVRIILRADSGFCRQRMLTWCERHGVGYVVGLAENSRLNVPTQPKRTRLAMLFEQTLVGLPRYLSRPMGRSPPWVTGTDYCQQRQSLFVRDRPFSLPTARSRPTQRTPMPAAVVSVSLSCSVPAASAPCPSLQGASRVRRCRRGPRRVRANRDDQCPLLGNP